jgi:hypothetical protein
MTQLQVLIRVMPVFMFSAQLEVVINLSNLKQLRSVQLMKLKLKQVLEMIPELWRIKFYS